jgi:hypothetical protein
MDEDQSPPLTDVKIAVAGHHPQVAIVHLLDDGPVAAHHHEALCW